MEKVVGRRVDPSRAITRAGPQPVRNDARPGQREDAGLGPRGEWTFPIFGHTLRDEPRAAHRPNGTFLAKRAEAP